MKVALDVSPGIVGVSGLRHYTEVTWEHLAARRDIDLRAFAAGRGRELTRPVRRLRIPLRVLHGVWALTGRPRAEDIAGDVDVVHSLDLMPPPTRFPLVVTVMDVLAITHPQYFPARTRDAQSAHLRGAHRADIVVTGCHATADEIASVTGIARERILVTPYGRLRASGETLPTTAPEASEPYLLSVGTIEPRKGYEVLAEAVARLLSPPRVLVAGPEGYMGAQIAARVRDLDRAGRFTFLGDVRDRARLAALYQGATLVVQPTHAEGFGFPVLEAMGQGCAVIATDIPQVREIASDTVLLVPAGDSSALAGAIQDLVADGARRSALAESARARSAAMTWEATTDALVGAYHSAVG